MRLPKTAIVFATVFLAYGISRPRDPQPQESSGPVGIADNSFLIEEAYNQEKRVVQHISNLGYSPSPRRDWVYSFTQEWPALGQAHQLGYTLLYQWLDNGRLSGIGDVMINYRYQWLADGQWAWVAPRLTVILPTGDGQRGFGNGSPGIQAAVPCSKELSGSFVIHANAGCTVVFGGGNPVSYFGGGSVIWRASQTLNFMFEGLAYSNASAGDAGEDIRETSAVLNPGFRFAMNFSHLQVVPGISVPVSFRNHRTDGGFFVYLSFEHPY